MKKRILAGILVIVLFCTALLPAAQAESTAKYYRIHIFDGATSASGDSIDFMVLNNQSYIHAEQLTRFLCTEKDNYTFSQSEENCAIIKNNGSAVYIFDFNSKNVRLYYSNTLVKYTAPFGALYLDNVAWLPFGYCCALMGISVHTRESDLMFIRPETSITEVLSELQVYLNDYAYDAISEIGYADWAYAASSISSTIVNFLDGLLDGSSFTALGLDMHAGIYNDNNVRNVADAFAKLTQEELEAFGKEPYQEVHLAQQIEDLKTIKDVTKAVSGGTAAANDWLKLGEKTINQINSNRKVMFRDLVVNLDVARLQDSSLFPLYNRATKKLADICEETRTQKKVMSKITGFSEMVNDSAGNVSIAPGVSFMDVFSFAVNTFSYMNDLSNRDSACIEVLAKYAQDSGYSLSYPLYDYAKTMDPNTDWFKSMWEFISRDGGTLVMDQNALFLPPLASTVLYLYDAAKLVLPDMRNTLSSMENFELAEYAIDYQNDSYFMAMDLYNSCFANDSIAEQRLKDLSDYMFAYLRFSMTARQFAIQSVQDNIKIDASLKNKLIDRMKEKNSILAESLVKLSQAPDGNATLDYGFLPSDSFNYLLNSRSSEANAIEFIETIGTYIKESKQDTIPDQTIDLSKAISEEEAIELVKTTLSHGLMDILDEMMDGFLSETLSFTVIDTYRVRKDNESYSDCYVIAMTSGGYTEENMFFVTLDGKDVWLGSPYKGEYLVLYQVDLLHFNPVDFIRLIAELEQELIKETIND